MPVTSPPSLAIIAPRFRFGSGPRWGPYWSKRWFRRPVPLRQRQELGAEAEQPARRDRELHARAVAVPAHVLELAPALADRGDDGARELLRAVDHELLVGLEELARSRRGGR